MCPASVIQVRGADAAFVFPVCGWEEAGPGGLLEFFSVLSSVIVD